MKDGHDFLGIDIFRHLLALCVIVQHMPCVRYSAATNARLDHLAFFVQGAVLTFFLLSGFFFRLRIQSSARSTLLHYFERQCKRLLVPFVLISAVNAAVMLARHRMTARAVAIDFARMNGVGLQMYFLPYLLVISFLVAVVHIGARRSQRREAVVLLAAAALLIAVALHYQIPGVTGNYVRLFPLYLLMFILGRLLALNLALPGPALSRLFLALSILFFGGLGMADFRFWYVAVAIAGFEFFYWVSAFLPNGRAPGSGGVYLLHTPANFAVAGGLAKFGITQFPNAIATVAVTYILCLAVTLFYIKALPAYRYLLLE